MRAKYEHQMGKHGPVKVSGNCARPENFSKLILDMADIHARSKWNRLRRSPVPRKCTFQIGQIHFRRLYREVRS